MSMDGLVGFWQAIGNDPKLRERVALIGAVDPDAPDEAFEPLSRVANQAGFECPASVLRSASEVRRFWNMVDNRSDLLQELSRADGMEPPQAIALIHGVAQKTGCRCTISEFDAISRQYLAPRENVGELSDEQLDSVSGGTYYYSATPIPNTPPSGGIQRYYSHSPGGHSGYGKYY